MEKSKIKIAPSAESKWLSGLQCRACCEWYGTGGHRLAPQTSTNACGHICRYMDQKGSAAMLTSKSVESAGVTPAGNLRNSMQARKCASQKSILALKPRAVVTRNPKLGYQWPHKKDLCPSKLKKISLVGIESTTS